MDTVLVCSRQNIALRGHRDDSKDYDSPNPALLNFRIRSGDVPLKKHFDNAPKNATYRCKTIQNQFVSVIGKQICIKIVTKVNACPFYSIIADEAIDRSNKEKMPLILRYIDSDNEIQERFMKYIHCITGLSREALSKKILETLNELCVPIENCRGQGYDGAGAMSSPTLGVTACIIQICPLAIYIHCGSHRLNLCIEKACSILLACNMIDSSGEITRFFNFSAIRSAHLEKLFSDASLQNMLGCPH